MIKWHKEVEQLKRIFRVSVCPVIAASGTLVATVIILPEFLILAAVGLAAQALVFAEIHILTSNASRFRDRESQPGARRSLGAASCWALVNGGFLLAVLAAERGWSDGVDPPMLAFLSVAFLWLSAPPVLAAWIEFGHCSE